MDTSFETPKKKRSVKKVLLRIVGVFVLLLIAGGIYLYFTYNRIISESLVKSFNSNIVSDVYELKFEKLSLNFALGDVKVYDAELVPRKKPLQHYPYINSSFTLKTKKMILKNVNIRKLIRDKILELEKIEIEEPSIDFIISDRVPIFFPFIEAKSDNGQVKARKRPIRSFLLREFKLADASFHVLNHAREREFNIKKINLSLKDIFINQQSGKDIISYSQFDFSIGHFNGNMRKSGIKLISFDDFNIRIDSLKVEKSVDSVVYSFADFNTGLRSLNMLTTDSVYQVAVKSFDLSYKNKQIELKGLNFKPNVSNAILQSAHKYQHTEFSGSIESIQMNGVDFDALSRRGKIFIDELKMDKVSASLYKDKTKPMDMNKFPQYLGQTVSAIVPPLLIKKLKATNVTLVNRERNIDGSTATAHINRATVEVLNITNQSPGGILALKGDAWLENKAHFNLNLRFSYAQPLFEFSGSFAPFNLADLNPLIESYTPASVSAGMVDDMQFSGSASQGSSSGTMKFLYHGLKIDIAIDGKAKWKSDVLAFGANSLLPSSNPSSENLPARVVQFEAKRNMNKSFVNLTIKSLLAGLKQTLIMSKENKKNYKKEKKEAKKEARQLAREEKKKAKEERRRNKEKQ